jgi:serine/threonine-protein kinase
VRSTPAGARVLLDGKNVGLTPLTLRDLEPGSHAVRIVRDGYVAVERRVALTRTRASQSIAVNLSRAPAGEAAAAPVSPAPASAGRTAGALVVDSRPTAAKVFVDGKLVGTTPLQVDSVDPGTHVVRMEREGYGPWSTSVRVAPGERSRVSASLER